MNENNRCVYRYMVHKRMKNDSVNDFRCFTRNFYAIKMKVRRISIKLPISY